MKRALSLLLLVASCTLDPVGGVLNRAALYVRAFNLPSGGKLHLNAVDSQNQSRDKRTNVSKETMDILFEEGTLAEGIVVITAELFDANDILIGCGTARGTVGSDEYVILGFASPQTSAVNCGSCGNRCETDVAFGVCIAGQCANWECPPDLVPQADGGCEEPVIVIPDAGPEPDAGVPDGGTPDAGPMDGGTCTPSAESSEAACADGTDNNCDLRIDCADPGCNGLTRPCSLGACGRMGVQRWNCLTRVWGACVGDVSPENTTTRCKDGIDNDCDGIADCGDSDCNGIKLACNGGVDICAGGVKLWNCNSGLLDILCLPYIPLDIENTNLTCSNGLDEDCDGKTDCADNSCRGKSCGSQGRVCCADGGCSASCN